MRGQRLPLESDEQKAFIKWLRLKRIKHLAIPNENQGSFLNPKTTMIQERKAQAMGKLPNAPDLLIFLPKILIALEMKRQRKKLKRGGFSNAHSKPSAGQLIVLEWMGALPYAESIVCYGCSDAIRFIEKKLKNA